ncbi:DUF4097 domain-containing protein [Streptomyces sp. NPDC058953]|uniref:DUF4097 family beta strand repeat-containing protein n=1 Tax=unclassified Streptomyces TaxID=2593676 RepID=UPI0036AAA76D
MTESTWEVTEPRRLVFDAPVTALDVRIVNGTVNVVGTDEGSARLEVTAIEGPPLIVTHEDGRLTVAYADLPWKSWLKWLDRKGWHRRAVVSLAVPAGATVDVGTVGAGAVVSGITGATSVRGISGETTLVRLSGPVTTETVSGSLEAQSLTGRLRFNSVSGDLTVIEGAGCSVRAETVSGDLVVDLATRDRDEPDGIPGPAGIPEPAGPTDLALTTISGEVAIRLPHPADAEVSAETAGGAVSSAFEDLRIQEEWGAKKVTGTLGAGTGSLKATTVSGSIALLRAPSAPSAPSTGGTDRTTGSGPAPREAQEEVL